MVKGTTRQVLVVRPQESDLFEQAIFLLREEALEQHGVTEQALLEEARWMVEELRVSLFAQTLGTSRKVSLQRITKLVSAI